VVNVVDGKEGGIGKSAYGSWEESADLSTLRIGEDHWKTGEEANEKDKGGNDVDDA
jgi:hypothetical protein